MHLKHLRPYQLHELVASGHPLLVPAGCIETHGPHMAIGHDTLIVEEICERVAAAAVRTASLQSAQSPGPSARGAGGGMAGPNSSPYRPRIKGGGDARGRRTRVAAAG